MQTKLKNVGAMPLLMSALGVFLGAGVQSRAAAPAAPQGIITYRTYAGDQRSGIQSGTAVPDGVYYPKSAEGPYNGFPGEDPGDPTTAPVGDVRNNYNMQIIGYFYPPKTGKLMLAIATDDPGQLYFSTDDNPANKTLIATESQWNPVRAFGGGDPTAPTRRSVITEGADPVPRPENWSAYIDVTQGKPYYIEGVGTEFGGGDNLAIAFRYQGDADFADNDQPISGQYLSSIDRGDLALPYASGFTASPGDVTYTLQDGTGPGAKQVDPASIKVTVDAAAQAATVSKSVSTTTVIAKVSSIFLPGSTHTAKIEFTGGSSENTFTVVDYKTLTPDLKVSPDTTKPGFSVFTYAVENDFADNLATAERVIAGQLKDADGNVFPNVADLSGAGTDGRFVVAGTINFSDADADTVGNFQNDPAVRVPGVTGADNYAQEIITYVELPAGLVQMAVNSDDAFKTTAGIVGDVFASGTVLGFFDAGRGAADTLFYFNVQEAGVYPFRTLWTEFGGDSNVEWFTVNGGQKVLINGTAAGVYKAYRAQAPGTAKAVVRKVVPGVGSGGAALDVTISAEIVDGGTPISGAALKLDGTAVNATVSKAGDVTTVSYKNTTPFAEASTHTATLAYMDGTTPITRDWKFTTQNNYLIAWWDFNDATDPKKALDKVGGAVGVMAAGAKFTDDAKGHTSKAGDRAAKIGSADPVVSGSVDVDAANSAFLNAGGIQNQLAVAYWQRLDEVRNSSGFWTTGVGQDRAFQAHSPWSDNTVYFDTGGGCCDGTQRIQSNLNDNLPEAGGDAPTFLAAWHHFLFQKNGDNKQVYIDGKLFFEGVNTSPLPFVFNRLTIGAINSGSDSTHGDIDDFVVFASPLTTAEIGKLASGTAPDQVRTPAPKPPTGGGAKFSGISASGGNITITWTGTGVLESGDSVTGPWTEVPGATSPYSVVASGSGKFYRFKP